RQKRWLETLDRRFFREQYDARRLLREIADEIREGHSLEDEAARVTIRLESTLHPSFAALLVRQATESFFRVCSAAPAQSSPVVLKKDSKVCSLLRLFGKPIDMAQADMGWLRQQLPREELELLRETGVDLLVPVTTEPQNTEMLLV